MGDADPSGDAAPIEYTLTVERSGPGDGTITSADARILCGYTCTAMYPLGAAVELQAMALSGSAFCRWLSPATCGHTPGCTVGIGGHVIVHAGFVSAETPCD
jgi:hypothetical protein